MLARKASLVLMMLSAASVFLGCGAPDGAPAKAPAAAGPDVTIQADDRPIPFWSETDAGVRVKNTLGRPIAIVSAALRTGTGRTLAAGGAETVDAAPADGGAVVEGTLLEDHPGPQARAKFPDRWDWKGGAKLTHFPVLQPGQTFSVGRSFRLTDRVGSALQAEVRYIVLADAAVLLRRGAPKTEPLPAPPGGLFGKGWVATLKLTVPFTPAKAFEPDANEKLYLPTAPAMPAFYPHAMRKGAFDALVKTEGKTAPARRSLQVTGPPISLADARKQAGPDLGSYTYCPTRAAWAFEAGEQTHLISAAGKQTRPGQLVSLIEGLDRKGSVELEIFPQAQTQDPAGHLAYLKSKGFQTASELQKGNTYRGTVTVKRGDLDKLVAALKPRGLKVRGRAIR